MGKMASSMILLTMAVVLSQTSAADPPSGIYCNSQLDCRIHCPITHQGDCEKNMCSCNIHPDIFCNDAVDCGIHCPVTHKGTCKPNSLCACNPIPGVFYCNDDVDCNIHCPITHVGKCQKEVSNNQTCTCNYHPTIYCNADEECRLHCPLTHRGRCKSDNICSCDPIPAWLLPNTSVPSTTPISTAQTSPPTSPPTTTERGSYCINDLDCGIHCPLSHKGTCRGDSTCSCDPHVNGNPVRCHSTMDCIQHCVETHVGTCSSKTHTCSCLVGTGSIVR